MKERKYMKKKAVRLTETQLKKIIAGSVRQALRESATPNVSFPDYETFFNANISDNNAAIQLFNQVNAAQDNGVWERYNEYISGFYKWIADNGIMMQYLRTNYYDEDYATAISIDRDNIDDALVTTFEVCGNEVNFETFTSSNCITRLNDYYRTTRASYPIIRPPLQNLKDILSKIGKEAFEKIKGMEKGTYDTETRQFI